MAHYRKIDVSIWNDEAFQAIWHARFSEKISVPASLRNHKRNFTRIEVEARSTRCAFSKKKKALFADLSSLRGAVCSCCSSVDDLVLDHVIPICWGGTNDISNFQILCATCNSAKGGKLPIPPEEVNHGR